MDDEIMDNECDIDDDKLIIDDNQLVEEVEEEHSGEIEECTRNKAVNSVSKSKKTKFCKDAKYDPTKLEDNVAQVLQRFKHGCECQDDQCFKRLNPEAVYRHRLNIAELTKAEHDMYLMGVTMACLTDPHQTARRTERRRLRAQYVYQGRRVCLDAFLYLENCTHYQVKRIRKHLITHGVTPRVHGNHGKVPHNTFSLDIYKIATEFLKNFVKQQEKNQKTKVIKNAPLHLPSEITRKTVHNLYKDYCKNVSPTIKVMGYSTFRRFMKVQFPQVKFAKLEFVVRPQSTSNYVNNGKIEFDSRESDQHSIEPVQIVTNDTTNLMSIVFANNETQEESTFIITPVEKVKGEMSYQLTTGGLLVNKSNFPITLADIGSK